VDRFGVGEIRFVVDVEEQGTQPFVRRMIRRQPARSRGGLSERAVYEDSGSSLMGSAGRFPFQG
jgi:hypothetical protein